MRHTRLFHTESFRLAAWFAVLFLSLTGALVGTVYWIVERAAKTELLSAIDNDIEAVQSGYRDKGMSEAIEVVQQLTPRESGRGLRENRYLLLTDAAHTQLAGNLHDVAPQLGLSRTFVPTLSGRDSPRRKIELIGKGVMLGDGAYLYAGRDTWQITATGHRMLVAFSWVAAAALLLSAVGGVLFSTQFMRRIDEFTQTCEAIVSGRFGDRIAVRGKGDELDRLATAVNGMLDRISALLDNLRQVSSDIAHDLRTPLTHLRQRLEAARDNSVTVNDYAAAVGRAIEDTDQALGIFNALLRISQIEAGTRAAAFTDVPLSDLLQELCDLYRPVAEDHRHTLAGVIPRGISVRGDAELINQMCANILENAIRHGPEGTAIKVILEAGSDGVTIVISDNGPGIPENEREHVFRRFYRLAKSRSTPGNGLGLALVSAIAELHGGKVELSDAAPGLKVSITLPGRAV